MSAEDFRFSHEDSFFVTEFILTYQIYIVAMHRVSHPYKYTSVIPIFTPL